MSHLFLLDPGHGKDTPGKRSPVWGDGSQFFEWEFTRDIVSRIMRWGPRFGLNCVNLVPEETDVPLFERVERARKHHKEGRCVYISVHANAGGGSGIEVFTSYGDTLSDRVANIFYGKYADVFPDVRQRTDYADGDPDKEAGFYVLEHTPMPAVLTENLFMDNEQECRNILMTEQGRFDIAQVYLAAMVDINHIGLEV